MSGAASMPGTDPAFPASQRAFGNGKTERLAAIMRKHAARPLRRLLVVGCGSGLEAAILAQELRCDVVGIDVQTNFDPRAAAFVRLERGDAKAIGYPDASFDYVYSYHALEHIVPHRIALAEMRRVLRPGGGWCIGTPNRERLLGYIGSADTTWREKLRWNLDDWRRRLAGTFRNEDGAHAGFGAAELRGELSAVFGGEVVDVGLDYYVAVYPRHASTIRALQRSGAGRLLFPSVYFVGGR